MTKITKFFVMSLILVFMTNLIWSETTKSRNSIFSMDTKQFHFGIGITATTGNLTGMIENVMLLSNNQIYDYPGWTLEQKEAVSKLDRQMLNSLIAGYILTSMEYGIRTRMMYHVLISDIDLVFLPRDGSDNGRFDFQFVPTIGIRLPWLLMPYITVGPSFTFSFYPDRVVDAENWKTKAGYGIFNNFAFRPGLNVRVGLDLNLRRITIGAFYQYEIKDFAEFSDYYAVIISRGYTAGETAWKIFGYQARFGASIVINLL